jgi:hypothetical protein
MRTFSLALALSLLAAVHSGADDEPIAFIPGSGGNPADINRDVLWLDNPDFYATAGSSEIIEAVGLETELANDFMLEADATVQRVGWWGMYWGGFEEPLAEGFNLRFYYEDVDCLPEAEPFVEYLIEGNANETLAEGGNMYNQFIYSHCVCVPLPAGQYWFSAQMADHPFPPQWARQGADMVRLCESAFRSEFFAFPEWVPAHYPFGAPFDASQMFEDECEATAIESRSWGSVKRLYW